MAQFNQTDRNNLLTFFNNAFIEHLEDAQNVVTTSYRLNGNMVYHRTHAGTNTAFFAYDSAPPNTAQRVTLLGIGEHQTSHNYKLYNGYVFQGRTNRNVDIAGHTTNWADNL